MNLPDKVPLIGHCANGVDRSTACLELEVAIRFAAFATEVVDGVFVYGAIAAAGVNEVAVWTPTGAGAPGRYAVLGDYGGDRCGHAAVPDAERAVL